MLRIERSISLLPGHLRLRAGVLSKGFSIMTTKEADITMSI